MSDGYAVVDVETMGFAATGRDRIVEVAVVQLDRTGAVTAQWCTLVNPGRDLGPQHVHRISAADARFISAEFDRLGLAVPVAGRPDRPSYPGRCLSIGHWPPACGSTAAT